MTRGNDTVRERSSAAAGDENPLKTLSRGDFRALGLEEVAYIRPVNVKGQMLFAICAADGTPLTMAGDYASAAQTVLQNDLHVVTLH